MAGCLIPHTPIAVDYWRRWDVRSKICFLSHMHTDHTQGLTSSWDQPIFCSEITRSLAIEQLKIQPSLLVAIPVGQSTIIPLDNEGVEKMTVTLIDANHCAGAVMFLFQGYFGCILHTGDFRYFDGILDIPPFTNGIVVNTLYLDNTYCDPKCEFPTKAEAKEKILEIIHNNPEKDIRFGMDMLGKEDLLCDVAKDQGVPIYVDEFRYKTAQLLGYGEYFTLNVEETYIRTERKSSVNKSSIAHWNRNFPTIGIIPSALYQSRNNPFAKSETLFVVPYSDHCSFSELKKFVAKLRPQRIVPVLGKKSKDVESCDRADMSIFRAEMSTDAGHHVFDVPPTVQKFISRDFKATTTDGGGKKRKASTSYFNGRPKRACGIVFSPKKQRVLCTADNPSADKSSESFQESENDKGPENICRNSEDRETVPSVLNRSKTEGVPIQMSTDKSSADAEKTLPSAARSSSEETCEQGDSNSRQAGNAPLSEQMRTEGGADTPARASVEKPIAAIGPNTADVAQSSLKAILESGRKHIQDSETPIIQQSGSAIVHNNENEPMQDVFDESIREAKKTLPGAVESSSDGTTADQRTKSGEERVPLPSKRQMASAKANEDRGGPTRESIDESGSVGTAVPSRALIISEKARKNLAEKALGIIISVLSLSKSKSTEVRGKKSLPMATDDERDNTSGLGVSITTSEVEKTPNTAPLVPSQLESTSQKSASTITSVLQSDKGKSTEVHGNEALPVVIDDERDDGSGLALSTTSNQFEKTPNTAPLVPSQIETTSVKSVAAISSVLQSNQGKSTKVHGNKSLLVPTDVERIDDSGLAVSTTSNQVEKTSNTAALMPSQIESTSQKSASTIISVLQSDKGKSTEVHGNEALPIVIDDERDDGSGLALSTTSSQVEKTSNTAPLMPSQIESTSQKSASTITSVLQSDKGKSTEVHGNEALPIVIDDERDDASGLALSTTSNQIEKTSNTVPLMPSQIETTSQKSVAAMTSVPQPNEDKLIEVPDNEPLPMVIDDKQDNTSGLAVSTTSNQVEKTPNTVPLISNQVDTTSQKSVAPMTSLLQPNKGKSTEDHGNESLPMVTGVERDDASGLAVSTTSNQTEKTSNTASLMPSQIESTSQKSASAITSVLQSDKGKSTEVPGNEALPVGTDVERNDDNGLAASTTSNQVENTPNTVSLMSNQVETTSQESVAVLETIANTSLPDSDEAQFNSSVNSKEVVEANPAKSTLVSIKQKQTFGEKDTNACDKQNEIGPDNSEANSQKDSERANAQISDDVRNEEDTTCDNETAVLKRRKEEKGTEGEKEMSKPDVICANDQRKLHEVSEGPTANAKSPITAQRCGLPSETLPQEIGFGISSDADKNVGKKQLGVAGANDEQSKSEKVTTTQDVSQTKPSTQDKDELLNILNNSESYVRIEVDERGLLSISDVDSPEELSDSQIVESAAKGKRADDSEAPRISGERVNETENSGRKENPSTLPRDAETLTAQSKTSYTSELKKQKPRRVLNGVEEPVNVSDGSTQITTVMVTSSDEDNRSVINSGREGENVAVKNLINSSPKQGKYKLFECDLKIEVDKWPQLRRNTKKGKKNERGFVKADSQVRSAHQSKSEIYFCTCGDNSPNELTQVTSDENTSRKLDAKNINSNSTSQKRAPKNEHSLHPTGMKPSEITSNENAENVENLDKRIQESPIGYEKTQSETTKEFPSKRKRERWSGPPDTKQKELIETTACENKSQPPDDHNINSTSPKQALKNDRRSITTNDNADTVANANKRIQEASVRHENTQSETPKEYSNKRKPGKGLGLPDRRTKELTKAIAHENTSQPLDVRDIDSTLQKRAGKNDHSLHRRVTKLTEDNIETVDQRNEKPPVRHEETQSETTKEHPKKRKRGKRLYTKQKELFEATGNEQTNQPLDVRNFDSTLQKQARKNEHSLYRRVTKLAEITANEIADNVEIAGQGNQEPPVRHEERQSETPKEDLDKGECGIWYLAGTAKNNKRKRGECSTLPPETTKSKVSNTNVSFARAVLERWIRENVKDGKEGSP